MLGTWLAIRTHFGPDGDSAQLGDLVDAFAPDKFTVGDPVSTRTLRSFIGVDIPPATLANIDPVKVNHLCTTPAVNYLTDPPTQIRGMRCQVIYDDLPTAAKTELAAQRSTVVDWDDIKDIIYDHENKRFVTVADLSVDP